MKPFKFLKYPIVSTLDDEYIFAGEVFYTMNKEDIVSPLNGKVTFKYTIAQRFIMPELKHRFKPDHDKLYYFKTEEEANIVKNILIEQDNEIEKLKKHYKITTNETI